MKCHDAAPLLSAARDGALSTPQRAELERHVAGCAACRQLQDELAAATGAFRADAARVTVPDADEEWRLVRARLRAPTQKSRRGLAPITWIGVPLAAAAAIAVAFFIGRPAPLGDSMLAGGTTELAHADFVEVTDPNATPIVYADKESGWLVVWAAEGDGGTNTSAVSS
jgi:anti-sigma factor RsiW